MCDGVMAVVVMRDKHIQRYDNDDNGNVWYDAEECATYILTIIMHGAKLEITVTHTMMLAVVIIQDMHIDDDENAWYNTDSTNNVWCHNGEIKCAWCTFYVALMGWWRTI